MKKWTGSDFESLSWHDCHVLGIRFVVGNPDDNDWTSDLVLDIDFIVEWICGVQGNAQFKVAPTDLVFHDVTDPRIRIEWPDTGGQVALQRMAIDRVERLAVPEQKVCFDRPYYRWTIHTNEPPGGTIAFCGSGFTQTLRTDPINTATQWLPGRWRFRMTRDSP